MKIIFMGSPEISALALQKLLETKHTIAAVVSQPDKLAGRGQKLTPCPVKKVALDNNLTIYTPANLRKENFHEILAKHEPDMIVVFAYGKILPKEVLDVPKIACINLHLSLLPRYRGAAPVQHAILNGEKYTGATIMKMDVGLDTGDIIDSAELEILEDDDAVSVLDTLTLIGIDLLIKTLERAEIEGHVEGVKQNGDQSSYANLIKKEDGLINWGNSSESIYNQIRGLCIWPVAFSYIDGKLFKIHKAEIYMNDAEMGIDEKEKPAPGTIAKIVKKHGPVVKTGDGYIIILSGQPENKKAMEGIDLINGGYVKEAQIFTNGK